jgi:hypothetical protein
MADGEIPIYLIVILIIIFVAIIIAVPLIYSHMNPQPKTTYSRPANYNTNIQDVVITVVDNKDNIYLLESKNNSWTYRQGDMSRTSNEFIYDVWMNDYKSLTLRIKGKVTSFHHRTLIIELNNTREIISIKEKETPSELKEISWTPKLI